MDNLFDQTIILHKKFNDKENKKDKIRKGEYTVEKKKNYNNSLKNLDEDTGEYKAPIINKKICAVIQKARLNKNLTQKTLAQKINIQVSQLNDFESGKKKPDNAILGKLERILGVKLRGNNSKLGDPLN